MAEENLKGSLNDLPGRIAYAKSDVIRKLSHSSDSLSDHDLKEIEACVDRVMAMILPELAEK